VNDYSNSAGCKPAETVRNEVFIVIILNLRPMPDNPISPVFSRPY